MRFSRTLLVASMGLGFTLAAPVVTEGQAVATTAPVDTNPALFLTPVIGTTIGSAPADTSNLATDLGNYQSVLDWLSGQLKGLQALKDQDSDDVKKAIAQTSDLISKVTTQLVAYIQKLGADGSIPEDVLSQILQGNIASIASDTASGIGAFGTPILPV